MYFFPVLLLWTVSANGLQEPRVVHPRLLEERSSDGAMVLRVHDQLTLNLKKASVAAPELRVLTEENGKTVTQVYNGEDVEKDLYEDEDNIASVAVTKDEHGVYMNGLVGPRHRIEPMPFVERSQDGVVPHGIYEIEQPEMMDRTVRHTEQDRQPFVSERQNGQNAQVPDSVQIELFFVSDGPHHRHFSSQTALLVYLCVTINSVNLRYRAASDPKISFIVTGVDMSVSETYASLYPQNPNYLHDDSTIKNLQAYAHNKAKDFNHPDVTYLMTGRQVYSLVNGNVSLSVLGLGFVSSVCTKSSVALGEDRPGFYTGVHTLAHELGHVMGAEHDGQAPETPGHPGALQCPLGVGNIMSNVDKGPSRHHFSWCSLRQMRYVIRQAGSSCWQVNSRGYAMPSTYPGMIVSLLAYCKEVVQDAAMVVESYTVTERTCKIGCRFYKWERASRGSRSAYEKRWSYLQAHALDYTICGNDTSKVCIQGLCQKKPNEPPTATTKKSQPVTVTPSTKVTATPTAVPTSPCICDCSSAAPTRPQMIWNQRQGMRPHKRVSRP